MTEHRCPLVRRYFRLALRMPDAPAVLGSDGRAIRSRSELAGAAARTGASLAHHLAHGKVALLSLPNGPDMISAFLALRAAGATVALADAAAPEGELLAAAGAVNAAVIVSRPERLNTIPVEPLGIGLGVATTGRDGGSPVPDADLFKLTSGSSGTPRAVALSVRQLVADTSQIIHTMGLAPEDTTLAAIPLTHSYGIGSCLVLHLLLGAPLAFPGSAFPAALADTLTAAQVRHFPAVPAMVRALAALDRLPEFPLLKLCLTAGAPLRPADAAAFHNATGIKVHIFYGSSECGGITFDRSTAPALMPGEVGSPLARVRVEIVDKGGNPLPTGMSGRVRVHSPAVGLGSTGGGCDDDGILGRTFLTGDVGVLDERGQLTLTGRVGEIINVAGKKVHPSEVRQVLEEMPGVHGAVVAGVPDPHRGQMVGAIVAATPGGSVTVSRLLDHCRGRMAPHKIPRRIVLVSELPVNDRGKISRETIEALLSRLPQSG